MATIIIQARLGSQRFPRKVLQPLPDGRRMIDKIIDESLGSMASQVILVTPDKELAESVDIESFVWDGPRDVLGEFWSAACKTVASTLIRLTADCPMITSAIIDEVYNFYLDCSADYVYNTHDSSPINDGIDVEVFTKVALKEAQERAVSEYDREHVTPYIRRHFKTELCQMPKMDVKSVNTYEDYIEVCRLLETKK